MKADRNTGPLLAPPRQERSRKTLERVLCAAEELLGERLFEALSMADVAARAGVSVGTIYTRFRTKEELLPALFARHGEAVGPRVGRLLEKVARDPTLQGRIELVVDFAVAYHVKHRGLLRALTMYVRAHPESVPAQTFTQRASQYRAVAEVLVGDAKSIKHTDPIAETEFCLGVVNSVCREQVLFGEVTPLKGRRGNAALKRRLIQLMHRDLTSKS